MGCCPILRQFVGDDYKIGEVWSQKKTNAKEYVLRHNGNGKVDDTLYYLHSFSDWTDAEPIKGDVKGSMIYNFNVE